MIYSQPLEREGYAYYYSHFPPRLPPPTGRLTIFAYAPPLPPDARLIGHGMICVGARARGITPYSVFLPMATGQPQQQPPQESGADKAFAFLGRIAVLSFVFKLIGK